MNKDAYDVFDKLPDLENALSKGPKMSLFYIANYIIRKDDCSRDDVLLNNTNFQNQTYGDFFLRLRPWIKNIFRQ